VCLAGSTWFLVAFFCITVSRINHPFALEWMEGTSLVQVQRILAGERLYVEPSLTYVPIIYPPLYFYVAALPAQLFGLSLLSLRLISLLSTLGCMAVIFTFVRARTGGVLPALSSVGFFAATFRLGGSWFDVARVDMLAVFLMLASFHLSTVHRSGFRIASGVYIALACLTKQTFVIVLAAMGFYFLIFRFEKRSVIFAISALGTFWLASIFLNWLHGGWYRFFVFELPSRHDVFHDISFAFRRFWLDLLVTMVPLLLLLSGGYSVLGWRGHSRQALGEFTRSDAVYFSIVAVAAIFLSWAGVANPGGYWNVLIPTFAVLAILSALSLDSLMKMRLPPAAYGVLGIACIIQFAVLYYPVRAQIPTPADVEAGNSLLARLRVQPGDVFVPFHSELAVMAGKPAYASYVAMHELEGGFSGGDPDLWRGVSSQLMISFSRTKFTLILLDKPEFWGSPSRYYGSSELVFEGDTFYPVTGWRTRPVVLYRRAE